MKLVAIAAVLVAACSNSSSSPPPGPEPDDWCRRVVAGPPSSDPDPIALANAHFTYRYFGMAPRETVDTPLTAAFTGSAIDLDAYAAHATDACVLDAGTATLGPARVDLRGDVAWIVPGTGDIAIPDGAAAIAIDLRSLPNTPDLADALARATAAAFATPVPRPSLIVTSYEGHPDSWFARLSGLGPDGIYDTALTTVDREAWPGTASSARPTAVITDVAMPPVAAALALELRAAGRAALVGHSVVARVAESDWRPVGTRGLAIRTGELVATTAALPDEIAADLRTDDADAALATSADVPALAAAPATVSRVSPRTLSFYDWPSVASLDAADLQAAVAVAYGSARGFFHIYDPWPTTIDTQYLASVAEAATPVTSRADARAVLERFAASLHDGHVYIANLAGSGSSDVTSVIPVDFDVIGGEPVVSSSLIPELHPGDTVVAVDGTPVAEFLAPFGARISSATPLNHAVITAARIGELEAATRTFTLRAVDGSTRTATVTGSGYNFPSFGPQRASGLLTDVGAADVYYINVNGSGGPPYTTDELLAQLDDARSAAGVIIDGRGYPGSIDPNEFLGRLIGTAAPSPQFHIPTWTGASTTILDSASYIQPAPTGAPYTKPVAILVGPLTQSFAEDIVMILEARADLAIVGRQTSGSNGNITSVAMPGGWGMAFTGMQVRFSDGSPFHGIGITPTIPSQPTAADFAAGIDRELVDGIAAIHAAAN